MHCIENRWEIQKREVGLTPYVHLYSHIEEEVFPNTPEIVLFVENKMPVLLTWINLPN